MKKAVIIILLIVLLLLLIPLRGQFKDGGTVHYDAILYDVYVLHSINPDSPSGYTEGVILEILGIQVLNSSTPHVDSVP